MGAAMAEVVTFGEAMVRLVPPGFRRLATARTLDVEIGGAELNAAAGLAGLGRSAAWVSRLPDHPLGRLVAGRAREAGVDDRFVQFAADARCGLYFCEFGAAPRAGEVHYDRTGSAAAAMQPGQFDWPAIFAGAKWFHVTGITPALSASAAAATAEALAAARQAGAKISFDLNFRRKLWTAADAGKTLAELIPGVDLLFASVGDAATLFGIAGDNFAAVAAALAARFGVRGVAALERAAPELAWRERLSAHLWQDGVLHSAPPREVEVVDRLGAGDLFASGVLHGLLGGSHRDAVLTGAALAALQHTVPGDLPCWSAADLAAALAETGTRLRR